MLKNHLLPPQALLKEVTDAAGQIILFIDEIHLVLGEWHCCCIER